MTSVPVNNAYALLNNVSRTNVRNTKSAASEGGFGELMLAAEGKSQDAISNLITDVTVKKPELMAEQEYSEQAVTEEKGFSRDNLKEDSQTEIRKSGNNDKAKEPVSDETVDEVTEKGEEMVSEISKETGFSEEEIAKAMEVLGLTAIDLLNPDNLKSLLLTLNSESDEMAILTDSTLFDSLQSLTMTATELTNELSDDLQVNPDELSEIINEVSDLLKGGNGASEGAAAERNINALTQDGFSEETPTLEGMKDYTVTKEDSGISVDVEVDDKTGAVTMTVTDSQKAENDKEGYEPGKETGRKQFGENKTDEAMLTGNSTVNANAEAKNIFTELVTETQSTYTSDETSRIMDQIMEHMRVNIKEDVQSIEMQLHPASLGNVNVQITSKDGMMTAQFTTQNELVKAAIESQLVELKTQFEEQGIKVNAVEVTVAEFGFDQNFAGQNEQAGDNSRKPSKGARTRRIDLDELDLEKLPDEMEDADRIAAEMMAANGNTVDYTA